MNWTEEKDTLMMREVAFNGLLLHKPGSKERGQGWQQVANRLSTEEGFLTITQRGVRERLTNIMKKHKTKMNREKNETGVGGNVPTEYEVLLEELININDDTIARVDDENEKKKTEAEVEKAKATEIRQIAMERMGETQKRKNKESPPAEKKCRRTSLDTMAFLREKLEADKENKAQERREHVERMTILAQQNEQQNMIQLQMNALLAQQTELMKLYLQKK